MKKNAAARQASPQRHREREEKDKFIGRGRLPVFTLRIPVLASTLPRDPRPEISTYTFMSTPADSNISTLPTTR